MNQVSLAFSTVSLVNLDCKNMEGTGLATMDMPVIVGLGCRLPGARTTGGMWRILENGQCVVGTVDPTLFDPAQYYDPRQTQRGKTYSIAAGQIDDLFQFDASFFGISPREAEEMDPQQRLMLQTTWEAVEDAGLDMTQLAGDRTGVFVGASVVDNLSPFFFDSARGGSKFMLGNTLNSIANRVSANFDFGGPSYVLDAACSSGLYALHNATQALLRDELDTAIVGAVHVVRAPGGYVGFSQAQMLSPTGLCRAFDESADGYVRSEACVVFVLQRPQAARRMSAKPRLRILASGVNTDGGASPLSVPSTRRQEKLIDTVLLRSDRDPEDFAFFEAHGTGTPIGDPVEAASIGGAVAQQRREPLLIGSAKTNFGHPEPAAGLVGLAKTMLAFEHRKLPASLHFKSGNPTIDFEGLNLRVNTQLNPLARTGPLVAGINSFGFGGTNVCVIVESIDDPVSAVVANPAPTTQPWLMLSAASDVSMRRLANQWAGRLTGCAAPEMQQLAAAATARAELPVRIALPLDQSTQTVLEKFASGAETVMRPLQGTARQKSPRTVFAFAGNGAPFIDQARAHYRDDQAFRASFDQTANAFTAEGIEDIASLLHSNDLMDRLRDPLVVQPLLFASQLAHAQSLITAGVTPDAVIGHSVGEIAALHIAQCFDLAAAVKIIASRSRALSALKGTGTMAALAASETEVEKAIIGVGAPDLAIAALNSPRSVTVSGSAGSIARLGRATIAGKKIAMIELDVDVPFHSPQMDPLKERFMADLADIQFFPPRLPVAASAAGRMLRPSECNADYLWRNVRDAVRFFGAFSALAAGGPCQVVEVASKATFAGNIRDMARFAGLPLEHFAPDGAIGEQGPAYTAARAWVQGVAVDRSILAGDRSAPMPDLPRYPWDETYYRAGLSADGLDAWGETTTRRLVGKRAERAAPVWLAQFSPAWPSWVADHKVAGLTVLPAAALIEMALDVGAEMWPDSRVELRDFDILDAALVPSEGIRIRTVFDADTGALTMAKRPVLTDVDWTVFARATLRQGHTSDNRKANIPPKIEGDVGAAYDFLINRALEYGPSFRRLEAQRRTAKHTVWGRLAPPTLDTNFQLDPTALDAAFHCLGVLMHEHLTLLDTSLRNQVAGGGSLIPVRVGHMVLSRAGIQPVFAKLTLTQARKRSVLVDLALFDADGHSVCTLEGVEFALVPQGAQHRIKHARTARRAVRLRLPTTPVTLPRGWRKPAAVLMRLGLADTAIQTVEAKAIGALRRAMVTSDTATQDALADVLRIAPQLADDCRILLASQNGTASDSIAIHSPTQQRLWGLADRVINALKRGWRNHERLNILIDGLPDTDVLRRLAADEGVDRVSMAAQTDQHAQVLQQMLPPDLWPLILIKVEPAQFDLAVSVGAGQKDTPTKKFLAHGGLHITLDAPDLLLPDGSDHEARKTVYCNEGPLPLRLRISRAHDATPPEPKPVIKPKLYPIGPSPTEWPALTTDLSGYLIPSEAEATHRVLVQVHRAGQSVPQALVDILMSLRSEIEGATTPLLILCFGAGDTAILAAGLSAAVATLANEYPDRRVALVSIEDFSASAAPDWWSSIIALTDRESHIHVNSSSVWGDRIVRMPMLAPTGAAVHLDLAAPGQLDSLTWHTAPRKRPGPREAEVTVAATGLNFRDVMWARGLLPERMLQNGASAAGLGMEFAGVIRRVGSDCRLKTGSRVLGFAASAFASSVTLPQDALFAVPNGLSLPQAAAVPVVFTTAWDALMRLARLQPAETVLIHGAAGGVGLAALQIAQLHGARVFATAGTKEKRLMLRALGAEAVFDSRNLGFADALRRATDGRGVDVVLNSLSGEAMQQSVECLAPFGRFVELGKRDFAEGRHMGLRPFAANLSYHAYDLDQRLAADPHGVAATLRLVLSAFEAGDLTPLPVTCFPDQMAEEAFRHMLASRHMGKLVVAPPTPRAKRSARPVRDDWVILGGTGGVGLAVAQELLRKGAARVHLVSRSPELPQGLQLPPADRARIILCAADASDPQALQAVFDEMRTQGQRLGGVIHAAMILRDRAVKDLDRAEADQVITAKLGVAITLDRCLRSMPEQPDHVVFFSSIAAQLGNHGQISYAASNAAMDVIARNRRQDGLPALAIGWGPISDRGYLTRNSAVATQLSKQEGLRLLTMRDVIAEMFRAIVEPQAGDYCYAAIDWQKMGQFLPALSSRTFEQIVPAHTARPRNEGALIAVLQTLEWSAALRRLEKELGKIVTAITRIPPDQFDPERPFGHYGLDSLMAMELRLNIEQDLGITFPIASFSHAMTARQLCVKLLAQVLDAQASQDATDPPLH